MYRRAPFKLLSYGGNAEDLLRFSIEFRRNYSQRQPKASVINFFNRECSNAHASKWHKNAVLYHSQTLSHGRRNICDRETAYWINYKVYKVPILLPIWMFSFQLVGPCSLCENSIALYEKKLFFALFFCKIAVLKM